MKSSRFPVLTLCAFAGFTGLSGTALAAVSGTVRNGQGNPVADALVRIVLAADSTQETSVRTDSTGAFSLALPQPVAIAPGMSGTGARANSRATVPLFFDRDAHAVRVGIPGNAARDLRGRAIPLEGNVRTIPEESRASGKDALPKSAAPSGTSANTYRLTIHGKGVYPLKSGDTTLIEEFPRAITLPSLDLWDSARTILRDDFANSRYQFQKNKTGRVAFLGGSITDNGGWRDSVQNYLKKKFPGTTFDFINAGIPSVGVNMHAFRMQRDVFKRGKVDLLFLESAVNDTTNNVPTLERTRAYEGIVRQARRHNPDMDIAFLYFADDHFYNLVAAKKPIPQVADYEKTALPYSVSSINLAQYVAERYTWAQFGGDVHPGVVGQGIYTRAIRRMFEAAWPDTATASLAARTVPHFVPPAPLDSFNFSRGRTDTISHAVLVKGWARVANWAPTSGSTRPGFTNIAVLETKVAGDTLSLSFTGTAIGIIIPAGPDVGILRYFIDGGTGPGMSGSRDQFTAWSSSLHIPWTHLFHTSLSNGPHEIRIVTAPTKNASSTGYASRIIRFVVNGE